MFLLFLQFLSSIQDKDDEKGKEIIPSPNPKAKRKEKETSTNEVDLEEDIVIPNWDLTSLTTK